MLFENRQSLCLGLNVQKKYNISMAYNLNTEIINCNFAEDIFKWISLFFVLILISRSSVDKSALILLMAWQLKGDQKLPQDNSLTWMPPDITYDTSKLVMAWWHQAPSHYLSQCLTRSRSPCGVTMTHNMWNRISCDLRVIQLYCLENKSQNKNGGLTAISHNSYV